MAFNTNSSTYKVWRNVVSYGADPAGVLDSTEAINNAISEGYRCGAGCNSSSVVGALVYFPAGTYLVSSSIIAMYNTQLVGDPSNPPTILAASSFVGLGVISSDVYIDGGNGAEWYINQNNFLRQIRNFVIDIRQATVEYPAGLHWQVAQGTSLQNIEFVQNTGTQQGIFAENGSGGWMSDLVFTGGNFGLYGGNQQFTVRNLKFTGCTTAIGLIWDWGWTWKDLYIDNCGTGINMIGEGGARNTGSVYILDSTFVDTGVAVLSTVPLSDVGQGTTNIVLDNVVLQESAVVVQDADGNVLLAGGTAQIDFWTLGRVYNANNPDGTYTNGMNISPIRPLTSSLRGEHNGGYFARSKPQYETYTSNQVVNVKTYAGAKGDGVSDDTAIIQSTLDDYQGQDVIIWFPAGAYIVTDTIVIPEGTKIVGEVWSQIMAFGDNFGDMKSPRVMVQVGNAGDVGSVEIQDMMFTTKGATAGAVLMEWNIKAESSGSAAMWDSHFRIGGAQGNELQVDQCPAKSTVDINEDCIAGSMLLHLTSSSSAYLEISGPGLQTTTWTTRLILWSMCMWLGSKGPTWLYGTASEHNVLYQYELYEAENIFMGMIQTESPYYPPVPNAPAPFEDALGAFDADPNFNNCATSDDDGCAVSWALRMISSNNIQIAGAGLYSWYQDHDPAEACVDAQNCQQRLVSTYLSTQIWLYNLITIGAVEMVSPYGSDFSPALAADNTDATGHPYWSTISAWLVLADGADANDTIDIPPPSNLETEDDGDSSSGNEDDSDDDGDDDDDDQPQEPETSSSSSSSTTSSTTSTSTTTTTTSSSSCSVVPTIAIATDAISFTAGSGSGPNEGSGSA
ncbi:pectate lyase superfamily protein-domain-containing protein [Aspergillus germanicus]